MLNSSHSFKGSINKALTVEVRLQVLRSQLIVAKRRLRDNGRRRLDVLKRDKTALYRHVRRMISSTLRVLAKPELNHA